MDVSFFAEYIYGKYLEVNVNFFDLIVTAVSVFSSTRGYYQLEFVGCFNRTPIPGPSVNFSIIPDPNKPVRLTVNYDTNARFLAGGTFPVFSVSVVSEEGNAMTNFNPADLSMWWWKGTSSSRPQSATELRCSKPMENEKKDCYHFRDKEIPQSVGMYTIQFSLRIEKTEVLLSKQIDVAVVANKPVKLGADCQPQTRVVSNSTDIANRILVESMTLKIMDQHGNPTGQDLNGKVLVHIKCPDGEHSRSLPLFEGKINSVHTILKEGRTYISRLAIMENSPGENGGRYILVFKPEVTLPSTSLSAFELPFHFYNDSENQRKMSELTKKKDDLTIVIKNYEKTRSSYFELHDMLRDQLLDISRKEEDLRKNLRRINFPVSQTLSIHEVGRFVREKTGEKERIMTTPRRTCLIPNNFSGPDVLGKVGHLAVVDDDAAAWVISWHLSGDMDCVVTRTTEAAQRIFRSESGRQQVMALDSIFVHQGNRPLPHIRNGQELFSPHGNPLYARNLLIYPNEEKSCEIVFKNLLGDTILMDDMDSATSYRKRVVEYRIPCPTILTRQGNRLSSRGKFGGTQNQAPPKDRVKMFGAPLPQRYYSLHKEIELLQQYHLTLEKKMKVENERKNLMEKSDMQQKQQKIEELKKQLQEIENQLASVRPAKRAAENIVEPSSLMTKRSRHNSINM